MNEETNAKLLTTIETAAKLKISPYRVWQLIKTGWLLAQKVGQDWMIKKQTSSWSPIESQGCQKRWANVQDSVKIYAGNGVKANYAIQHEGHFILLTTAS